MNAILTGALIQSSLMSFLLVHLVTVAGVSATFTLSKIFLGDTINKSEFFVKYLATINSQFQECSALSLIVTISSLRIMPSAPNIVYNLVFPHIKSIGAW